ncbi:exonuclease [Heliobacterium gestii]|uniref:Exonuclease n=1 Tax=Heliomicrobium gestii TaxID=2699 RepID=A0A845LMS8_HELGE|nr:3'-5' exonuclease [Heliomicrobium gestii]MBM7867803.1 DNA polymerase-3 subunit epsilon [Heliomicrobium gestii]MZP44196.1 exonuclease [Heliomicrobium gestii]
MDFTAIDFETANSARNSACAIGLTVVAGGKVAESCSWLIRPPVLYFPFTYIHGITAEQVKDEPTFDMLWPTLRPYLQGQLLVAHNATFDKSVLENTLRHYGLSLPDARYICSVETARKTWPSLRNHKLNTVAEFLGVQLNHHDACDDAYASAQIVLQSLRVHKMTSVNGLIQKLSLKTYLTKPEETGMSPTLSGGAPVIG